MSDFFFHPISFSLGRIGLRPLQFWKNCIICIISIIYLILIFDNFNIKRRGKLAWMVRLITAQGAVLFPNCRRSITHQYSNAALLRSKEWDDQSMNFIFNTKKKKTYFWGFICNPLFMTSYEACIPCFPGSKILLHVPSVL